MTIHECITKALTLIGIYSEGGSVIESDDPRYIDLFHRMISAIDTAQREISDHMRNTAEFKDVTGINSDTDIATELSLPEYACTPIPFFAAACAALTIDLAISDRLMELYYQKLENLPYGERYTSIKNSFFS